MAEPLLKPLTEPVETFLEQIEHPRKQEEAKQLIALYQQITGYEPIVWGGGIIGFGQYHYQYDSGREGNAPLAAFAPRKARHSIYLEPKFPTKKELLARLGKHKESLGCVYINKLPDVDLAVLKELIAASTKETLRKNNLPHG
ncbi:DUF1801 domain-containing protein [Enterococcus asini]|uniref:DUF1801 domain-containing protein n=1 Tax=Enterococcus asini TaxID=57732 RepID=UPI00288F8925|nr:DUF1801 domain-containing protein [Enterococcus asini]MDT2756811.1 DUF1801 domain-containing protein [Enterococcus asini]